MGLREAAEAARLAREDTKVRQARIEQAARAERERLRREEVEERAYDAVKP